MHLVAGYDGFPPEEGVGSLARFAALRSLSLRHANVGTMSADTPPLPSGLRRVAWLVCCCSNHTINLDAKSLSLKRRRISLHVVSAT